VERVLEPLEEDERVAGVSTAYENGATDEAMISRNGHYSLVVVELEEGGFAELRDASADVRQEVRPGPLEVVATGEILLNEDFESVTETDLKRAEVVSLPLALSMLLFVFGSVVAAGLHIGVGVLAITAGFVGTLLLARAMDVSIYATNIVTMIGLGVAKDYSLFVVSRFREEVGRRPVPARSPGAHDGDCGKSDPLLEAHGRHRIYGFPILRRGRSQLHWLRWLDRGRLLGTLRVDLPPSATRDPRPPR
jgi:RND superfamily putative drug exporter